MFMESMSFKTRSLNTNREGGTFPGGVRLLVCYLSSYLLHIFGTCTLCIVLHIYIVERLIFAHFDYFCMNLIYLYKIEFAFELLGWIVIHIIAIA